MTGEISTNDSIIQRGGSSASSTLDTATRNGGRPAAPGADPRLAAAVESTSDEGRRSRDKTADRIGRSKDYSTGQKGIDASGASKVSGVGGKGSDISAVGGKLASAAGAGVSGLIGSAGQAVSSLGQMPQVPASSAGQSTPTSLSNPQTQSALAQILGDSGSGGSGGGLGSIGSGAGSGFSTPGGSGGGSGTTVPSSGGSTEREKKVIDLANQVVSEGWPYSWGSGGINGPTMSGTRDGGAADAAGDYAKTGFDCSGLSQYLTYQSSGVEIPRFSGDQYSAGQLLDASSARPGDLVFPTDPNQHVQIYVGDGKVVEAQQSGTQVMFSDASPSAQYVRVATDAEAA